MQADPSMCHCNGGKRGGQELNYISDVDVMYVLGDSPAQQNGGEPQSAEMVERATKMANINQRSVLKSGQ